MARRGRSLLLALAMAGAAASPSMAGPDALKARFVDPPASARPWVRWWWPGGAVSDGETAREIAVLKAAGFGGAEIQPFTDRLPPLPPAAQAAVKDYATRRFFAHVAAAADAASASGLQLDYTFGSGWPSGGGEAITPERASVELQMAATTLHGPAAGPIRLNLPKPPDLPETLPADWRQRLQAQGRLVAVVAVRGSAPLVGPGADGAPGALRRPGRLQADTAVVLTGRLGPDGRLDWSPPPGEWQVFVFRQAATGQTISIAAGEGPQLALDHFDAQAFAAHAARVGGAGSAMAARFGHGLRADFIDSLEVDADIFWSRDFLEQFRRRRGYDLTPWLPLVVTPTWQGDTGTEASGPLYEMASLGPRVQADYRLTLAELLAEKFYQPFVAWTHAHGLKARVQPYGAPVDILKVDGLVDIPETEDLYAGPDPDFLRLPRSAGDIYGARPASAESFVFAGKGYRVTPALLKQRADLLFSSGVDAIMAHGFAYRLEDLPWPGWYPFVYRYSTMLDEADPIWAVMPDLTGYMARVQAVLQAGTPVVPVALYMAGLTVDAGAHPRSLGPALQRAGYDFDLINADGLLRSRVEGRALVTPAGHRYRALLLPKAPLRPATAERVRDFARQGLAVVFVGGAPDRGEGLLDAGGGDGRVRSAMAAASSAGARVAPEDQVAAALRSTGAAANLSFTSTDPVPFVETQAERRRFYFLSNPAATPVAVSFIAPGRGEPESWDPWSGAIHTLGATAKAEGVEVSVALAAGGSALIAIDPDKPLTGPRPAVRHQAHLAIDGPWSLHASGHGGDGAAIEVSREASRLQDWRDLGELRRFSGRGVYDTRFEVPGGWLQAGHRVRLSLGEVHDAAVVLVNGRRFALVQSPFDVDITEAVRAGANQLSVTVVNAPQNAMIAASGPMAPKGSADLTTAMPAGLIGPVALDLYDHEE